MVTEFVIGSLYSNEEIFKALHVANAGGIRLSTKDRNVNRVAIMTSNQEFHLSGENPYHDRLENDIWRNKIETNRKRDLRNTVWLRRQGCRVIRIWEHNINRYIDAQIKRIISYTAKS
jgi:hypothetical protein